MQTVLDFRSIDSKFRTGLIFSIFEGLKIGHGLKVIFDHDPADYEKQFKQVHSEQVVWKMLPPKTGVWEVEINKSDLSKEAGCCGICGGHGEKHAL